MTVTRELPADFHSTRLGAWGGTVFGSLLAWYLTGAWWAAGSTAALGLYWALSLELRAWRIRRNNFELDVRENSFVLRRGADSRECRDADVAAVAYARFNTFKNGVVDGHYRRFRVWMSGDEKPIVLEHFFKTADPLDELLERLIARCLAKSDESLKAGGEIHGDGWRLQGATFFPRRGMPLPLADVTGVGVYDGSVCLWVKHRLVPDVKVPVGSRNAVVLLRLLQSKLSNQPPHDVLDDASGLGRVLFERRHGYLVPRVLLAIGALLLVGGLFSPDPFAFALVAAVFGIVGGILLRMRARTFRCHERGVYLKGPLLRRMLRYEEVASFTYRAVCHYNNLQYEGTYLTLGFQPAPGARKKAVRFKTWFEGGDADLDKLRDFIAGVIAGQMRDRLERDGSASWTNALRFLPAGLEYRPRRLIGKSEPVDIPYASCERLEFANGAFKVFPLHEDRPLFALKSTDENFFPGYFLFSQLTGKTVSLDDR